jgi:hypothetical protein
MQTAQAWLGRVALIGAVLTGAGCATIAAAADDIGLGGPAGTIYGDRNAATLHGEVRSVDTRQSRLQLREDRGRNQTVRYDNRTRVVYGQRSYPVSALERGDRVRVRVVYDRNGRAYADRVDVFESSRNRGRASDDRGRPAAARVQRVDGTVSWVDSRSNAFALASRQGRPLAVHVPRDLNRNDRARFDRLRRGARISVDVRPIGRDQYELVRFR